MGVFGKLAGIFGGGNKSSNAGGKAQGHHTKVSTPFDAQQTQTAKPSTTPSGKSGVATAEPKPTAGKPLREPVAIDLSVDDDAGDLLEASHGMPENLSMPLINGADLPPPPPPPAYTTPADTRRQQFSAPLVREEEIRTPRNRQELVEELQKSYAEVVTLIRKVDGHLDSQDKRSERLLQIAETLPTALQDLSEIRRQHTQLAEAIDRLTESTRESASRSDAARSQQLEALGEVRSLLHSAGEHERRVADSLDEFKSSIGEVAISTGKLGGVLEGMEARQQRREDDLRQAIESGQKWMATAVVLGLVCLGIVVIVGVLAFAG